MRLVLLGLIAILMAATPAAACRVPASQFEAAFRELPHPYPGGVLLHGRLIVAPPDTARLPEGEQPDIGEPVLFGRLVPADQGAAVEIYRPAFRSSCDVTPADIFDGEVWLAARPLTEVAGDNRFLLLVRQRSGQWAEEYR